jgi:hypothetical protein
MNTEIHVGPQVVVCDREATIALYANAMNVPGANQCGCVSCKNFAAQRSSVYPDEFLSVLKQLGGDPLRELEAFDYDFDNRERHLYGGWFVFCGELVEGTSWRPEQEPSRFSYWFTTSFPRGGLPTDVPLCAIEFCAEIPWVISENP